MTTPNPEVTDIRDLVSTAIECHRSDLPCIDIDDTQIALVDPSAGAVWLITIQPAKFEVAT